MPQSLTHRKQMPHFDVSPLKNLCRHWKNVFVSVVSESFDKFGALPAKIGGVANEHWKNFGVSPVKILGVASEHCLYATVATHKISNVIFFFAKFGVSPGNKMGVASHNFEISGVSPAKNWVSPKKILVSPAKFLGVAIEIFGKTGVLPVDIVYTRLSPREINPKWQLWKLIWFLIVFISTCLVTVTPQCGLFFRDLVKRIVIKNLKSATPL